MDLHKCPFPPKLQEMTIPPASGCPTWSYLCSTTCILTTTSTPAHHVNCTDCDASTAHELARVLQRQHVVQTKQACPRMQQSRSGLYVSVMQSHALCESENGEVPCIQQHVCCCGCCQKILLARQTSILGCRQQHVWWCKSLKSVPPLLILLAIVFGRIGPKQPIKATCPA